MTATPEAGMPSESAVGEQPVDRSETSGPDRASAPAPGVDNPQAAAQGPAQPETAARMTPRQRRSAPSESEPPEPDTGEFVARVQDEVKNRLSGQASASDEPRTLDADKDTSYTDPATIYKAAEHSRILIAKGIKVRQGAVTTGDNSPAMNQVVNIGSGTEAITIRMGRYTPEQVQRLLDSYPRNEIFDAVHEWLVRRHVAVIRGVGIGRRATAVDVLRKLMTDVYQLDTTAKLEQINLGEQHDVPEDCGYILEYERPIQERDLNLLELQFGERRSKLIILAPPERGTDERLDGAFRYERDESQGLDPGESRSIAARALSIASDDDTPEKTRQQTFRLAYAVFNECLMGDVLHAADLLHAAVHASESREKFTDHIAFDGRIDALLDSMMWVVPSEPPGAGPQRAKLRYEELSHSFLDVVWNDYDALRQPLLVWLELLTIIGRPVVQIRAAHAAGILATFDFDEVCRALIRPWARGTLRYRLSAAFALEVASEQTEILPRIRRQVTDWSQSPNPRLQDTAARCYGRLVGKIEIAEIIEALGALGAKSELAASTAIAASMVVLFTREPSLTLQTLASWHESPNRHLRRHSRRSVALLVRLAGPGREADWPAMTSVMGGDGSSLTALARMWSDALVSADTAWGSWEPLRRWILAADEDPELAEGVIAIGTQVLAGRGERARFHLLRWRARHPNSDVLKKIDERLSRPTRETGS